MDKENIDYGFLPVCEGCIYITKYFGCALSIQVNHTANIQAALETPGFFSEAGELLYKGIVTSDADEMSQKLSNAPNDCPLK